MNEEEKKAIKILAYSEIIRGRKPENDAVEILISLIERQQQELERIKSLDIYKLVENWEKGELVSKDKIREFLSDKITYRQFELQQEYKDFKDDIKLNTLQDIKKELLEE